MRLKYELMLAPRVAKTFGAENSHDEAKVRPCEAKISQDGAKMRPRWAKMRPR